MKDQCRRGVCCVIWLPECGRQIILKILYILSRFLVSHAPYSQNQTLNPTIRRLILQRSWRESLPFDAT